MREIHGWINFSWSLEHIVSFCNAFSNPHKGAKTMLSEEVVYLSKVRVSDQGEKFHPFQNGIDIQESSKYSLCCTPRWGINH